MDPCDKNLSAYFNRIIESDIALPELANIDDRNVLADVLFQISTDQSELTKTREWLHHWKAPNQRVTLSIARDKGIRFLHFPDMACFTISNSGHLVTCHAGPSLSLATIRHLLLDQVLPRLFAHFFLDIVFHASFLSVNGKGIRFLADSGWGKSTIAAGLGAAGHTILTDDCLNIALRNQHVIGTPAYYGIRLLPDSIENIGVSLNFPVEAVAEYTSKKRIPLEPIDLKNLSIVALFLLTSPKKGNNCKEPEIAPVGGMYVIKELLKNSFCLDVEDQQWQKLHFQRISQLAVSGLPIFTLSYQREYRALAKVVTAIVKTVDQL